MATQTRRTTRRTARFFRATVNASLVTAYCGLVLWSAVAAHAAISSNGMPFQGLPYNGMPFQGMQLQGIPFNGMPHNGYPIQGLLMNGTPLNGMPFNGIGPNGMPYNGTPMQGMPRNGLPLNGTPLQGLPAHEGSLCPEQSERLPWSTLSQRPLGTTPPSHIGFLDPCSRYRLGPLCL
jgi:hypothetical protein